MEFLGVGPGELILVLIIALVVVGPERLPVLARQAGRFLVTIRDWVQKSPDAAMILRARAEIEQELASLRSSLAEVQSARDEVIQVTKQLNQVVSQDVIGATRESIQEINQLGTVARSTKPNGMPAHTAAELSGAEPVAEPAKELVAADGSALDTTAQPEQLVDINGSPLSERLPDENTTIAPPRSAVESHESTTVVLPQAVEPSTGDLNHVLARIDLLAAELHALQASLIERGVIEHVPTMPADADSAQNAEPANTSKESPGAAASPTDATPLTLLEEPVDVDQHVYSRD